MGFNLKQILFVFILLIASCKKDKINEPGSSLENTYGYGVLQKVRGIWNGPVTSTTALGSFPEWIVDFRPISENQISAKNELDTVNNILMSFFITKYNNEYRVAFRNGGGFAGSQRISYFLADSVYESSNESFYRFSEIINGTFRAYTNVIVKGDSLKIHSFTNRYNTQTEATPHMAWNAKLQDLTSSDAAKNLFNFPKKTLTKDFSNSFSGLNESIFYNSTSEPYPNEDHPHLGSATINYSFASNLTPNAGKNVIIILSTQPLINGFNFNPSNLRYRSRYVILPSTTTSFTFDYMHPGTYYTYALYDNDGNNNFGSGDWISTASSSFTLAPKGTATGAAQINFVIP